MSVPKYTEADIARIQESARELASRYDQSTKEPSMTESKKIPAVPADVATVKESDMDDTGGAMEAKRSQMMKVPVPAMESADTVPGSTAGATPVVQCPKCDFKGNDTAFSKFQFCPACGSSLGSKESKKGGDMKESDDMAGDSGATAESKEAKKGKGGGGQTTQEVGTTAAMGPKVGTIDTPKISPILEAYEAKMKTAKMALNTMKGPCDPKESHAVNAKAAQDADDPDAMNDPKAEDKAGLTESVKRLRESMSALVNIAQNIVSKYPLGGEKEPSPKFGGPTPAALPHTMQALMTGTMVSPEDKATLTALLPTVEAFFRNTESLRESGWNGPGAPTVIMQQPMKGSGDSKESGYNGPGAPDIIMVAKSGESKEAKHGFPTSAASATDIPFSIGSKHFSFNSVSGNLTCGGKSCGNFSNIAAAKAAAGSMRESVDQNAIRESIAKLPAPHQIPTHLQPALFSLRESISSGLNPERAYHTAMNSLSESDMKRFETLVAPGYKIAQSAFRAANPEAPQYFQGAPVSGWVPREIPDPPNPMANLLKEAQKDQRLGAVASAEIRAQVRKPGEALPEAGNRYSSDSARRLGK